MNLPIYLDYASTTPVDPAVADQMVEFLTPSGHFGNPASRSHMFGWQAEAAVEDARADVAGLIGADPREIVWTSGATEANNLAIKGCAHFNTRKGKHIITSKIEHKAVLDTCRQLEREGFEHAGAGTLPRWQEVWDPNYPPGQVEHIADASAFLVSDLSSNTTGTIITIDGGHCAR